MSDTQIDMFGITELGDDERVELIRQHLLNLISSYSDEADVFTEIIQNAVDAIERRKAENPSFLGELLIIVGRRGSNDHYIYVQDNGAGMTPQVADKVFIPGFSTGKKRGRSIGYKGVGMSFVVAVSNHLSVRSRTSSEATERTVLYAHDWVTDSEKPFPAVTPEFKVPATVEEHASEITQGTGVYFAFHSGRDPKSLDNLVKVGDGIEKEVDSWASLLCARTPLGLAVSRRTQVERPISVRIVVDLGEGDVFSRQYSRSFYNLAAPEPTLGYPFPDSVFRVGKDTAEIDATNDAQRSVTHAHRHQAVFHEWTAAELLTGMDRLDDDERNLLELHLEWVRGYLGYGVEMLEQVRLLMGTRSKVVRYGAKLAVDGAPQGRPLELTLTSDQGLDRQTHIVFGVKEMELDTGRKFVSDERLLSAINKVGQRVVTRLKDYRWTLKIRDRPDVASDFTSWVNSVTARAGNSVIPLLFEGNESVPPARVDPANEQEVIALWTAILATGLLPGYQMVAISGFNRYDALVNITGEAVSSDGQLAPIGTEYEPKANAVLEFKHDFDSILTDFDNKVKVPSEIDLIVCWDCPDLNMRRGSLTPVYGPNWGHGRPTRGVSYVWRDVPQNVEIRVVALRNLVAELLASVNDASGQAALQVLTTRDVEKSA